MPEEKTKSLEDGTKTCIIKTCVQSAFEKRVFKTFFALHFSFY